MRPLTRLFTLFALLIATATPAPHAEAQMLGFMRGARAIVVGRVLFPRLIKARAWRSVRLLKVRRMPAAYWRRAGYRGLKARHYRILTRRRNTVAWTGVRYDRYGFPKFASRANVKLPRSLYREPRRRQMAHATRMLRDALKQNPALKKGFSPGQLADIRQGKPHIRGLAWHHHQQTGWVQLVSRKLHRRTPHIGGTRLWARPRQLR